MKRIEIERADGQTEMRITPHMQALMEPGNRFMQLLFYDSVEEAKHNRIKAAISDVVAFEVFDVTEDTNT